MPRFPNLWFHVAADLASSYLEAVRLVIDGLAETCSLVDDFEHYSREAADEKARVRGLLPYSGFEATEYNHDHDLHIRYYYSELGHREMAQVELHWHGGLVTFYRLAASVHFEVAQDHPHHPYIHPCPVCGCTAEYHVSGDPCERVHDPLGLELLLDGAIRGRKVLGQSGKPVCTVRDLADRYAISCEVADARRGDVNTARVGCAVIEPVP